MNSNQWARLLTLLTPILLGIPCMATPKINVDYQYTLGFSKKSPARAILGDGERIENQYDNGDIETIISMTPHWEGKKGTDVVHLDIHIQNFRDGDLISESTPTVKARIGQKAKVSVIDADLNQTYDLFFRTQRAW